MRLAIAIEDGWNEGRFDAAIEPVAAALLDRVIGAEILIWPASETDGAVGTAKLLAIEAGASGLVAHFEPGRYLADAAALRPLLRPPFPVQLLTAAEEQALVAAADIGLFRQAETPMPDSGLVEAAAPFAASAWVDVPTGAAIAQSLWRETGGRCALTGVRLDPLVVPCAIRADGSGGFHLNNLLLLSATAEAAFCAGHFSARDDLSVLADLSRIDPELLETINPDGRLHVPANPALRPAAENLAWHRHHVFRLG